MDKQVRNDLIQISQAYNSLEHMLLSDDLNEQAGMAHRVAFVEALDRVEAAMEREEEQFIAETIVGCGPCDEEIDFRPEGE